MALAILPSVIQLQRIVVASQCLSDTLEELHIERLAAISRLGIYQHENFGLHPEMKRAANKQRERGERDECSTCKAAGRNGLGHPAKFCAWPGGAYEGDYSGAAKAKRIAAKDAKRLKASASDNLPDAAVQREQTVLMANIVATNSLCKANTEALDTRRIHAKGTDERVHELTNIVDYLQRELAKFKRELPAAIAEILEQRRASAIRRTAQQRQQQQQHGHQW